MIRLKRHALLCLAALPLAAAPPVHRPDRVPRELLHTLPGLEQLTAPHIDTVDLLWTDNLDTAFMTARARGQQILALYSTPACAWCRRLKAEVLAHPDLRSRLRNFTLVEINTDRNPAAAHQRGIQSVPTLLWMDANGRERFRVPGFIPLEDLTALLDQLLTPGQLPATAHNADLLQRLTREPPTPERLAEALARLPDRDPGGHLRETLRKLDPPPVAEWIHLLRHPRLAVRLGALEFLEELSGTARGFDPWADPLHPANLDAHARWRAWWNDTPDLPAPRARYARLSPEQLDEALHDLASDLPERANRAMRTLELAGPALLPRLTPLLETDTLPPATRERLDEIILTLHLTRIGRTDPATTARRLRQAPLDTRLSLLRDLRELGPDAAPVLLAFLDDPDILIREAVVEGLLRRGGPDILPAVLTHLETEAGMDVAVTAMRNLRHALPATDSPTRSRSDRPQESAPASAWLLTQLDTGHEERILAALNAIREGHHPSLIPRVTELLQDPRWRVRAEVARTLGGTRSRESLITLLEHARDPDPFARSLILQTALGLAESAQQRTRMLEAWWQEFPDDHTALLRIACDTRVDLPEAFFDTLTQHSHSDLITLLGIVEGCTSSRLRAGLQLAEHPDPDVRAAALRLLARHGPSAEGPPRRQTEQHLIRAITQSDDTFRITLIDNIRLPRDPAAANPLTGLLTNILRSTDTPDTPNDPLLDDLLGAFDTPAPDTPPPPADTNPLDDLLSAFEAPETPAHTADDTATLESTLLTLFHTTDTPALRHITARLLVELGNPEALPHLLQHPQTHPEEDLTRLLQRPGNDPLILQAARALLDDPRPPVRSAALLQLATRDFTRGFLPLFYQDPPAIAPRDIPWNRHQLREQFRQSPLRELRPHILHALQTQAPDGDGDTPHARLSLGFALAAHHRDPAFLPPLQTHTGTLRHPDLRAQAWIARARQAAPLTDTELHQIANDPATPVRTLLPWLHLRSDSKSINWNILPDLAYSHSHAPPVPRLTPAAETHLLALLRDPVPEIQLLAGTALISQGTVPEDTAWLAALPQLQDPRETAHEIWDAIETRIPRLSADYRPLINWLSQMDLWRAEERLNLWRTRNRPDTPETDPQTPAPPQAALLRTPTDSPTHSPSESPDAAPDKTPDPGVTLLYFYSQGCPDCELVREMLNTYQSQYPDLHIREYNIADPGSEDLYYEIYLSYGLPLSQVGLTPMLAGAGGADCGGEALHFDRIGDIIARSVSTPGTAWIPTPRPVQFDLQPADMPAPLPAQTDTPPPGQPDPAPAPRRLPERPPLSPRHQALLLLTLLFIALYLPLPPAPRHLLPVAGLLLLALLPVHLPPEPLLALLTVLLLRRLGTLIRRPQSNGLTRPIHTRPTRVHTNTLLYALTLPLLGAALPLPHWHPALTATPLPLLLFILILIPLLLRLRHPSPFSDHRKTNA